MGVGGNPGAIEKAGRDLQGGLDTEPKLPPTPSLPSGTPLAGDLARTHNEKVAAAATFVAAKDEGIRALSRGLVEMSTGMAEIDRGGAVAIEALFPSSTPGVDGGQ